jgi:hypothetical protein
MRSPFCCGTTGTTVVAGPSQQRTARCVLWRCDWRPYLVRGIPLGIQDVGDERARVLTYKIPVGRSPTYNDVGVGMDRQIT